MIEDDETEDMPNQVTGASDFQMGRCGCGCTTVIEYESGEIRCWSCDDIRRRAR